MNIKIHPEGKIDIKRVQTFEEILARLDQNRDNFHPDNIQTMKKLIYDARLGKTIIGRAKKKIDIKRLQKYIQDLKKLDHYFKKPFKDITEEEFEIFILDLEEGRYKQPNGNPYASETQVGIKKVIKKFYKWLEGENETVPKKVRWIDTSCEPKEYQALTKAEVDTIIAMMTSNTSFNLIRNRALIMVLFDSGTRIEELYNVRLSHLTIKNGEYNMRIEHHKGGSKKRTITLPFCKKFLDLWLDIHPKRTEPNAQLFPISYNAARSIVNRAGKTIKKRLTPHGLRHSSATFWCQELSQFELCYRMGWAMSSRMPNRYIDREGLYQEKAAKVVRAANIEEIQQENAKLSQRLASMEDFFNKHFKEDIEEAKQIIELVKKEQ